MNATSWNPDKLRLERGLTVLQRHLYDFQQVPLQIFHVVALARFIDDWRAESLSLSGAARAVIDPAKLTGYLLSFAHPVGCLKAAYFARLGCLAEDWRLLESVLLDVADSGTVEAMEETSYGRKCRMRGAIDLLIGGEAVVVTVWIIRSHEDFPRFVTAFPAGGA